ncbi:unnamed protein product [Bursaphelenchus xylophilus]|uniref:(pine wood nematode) hypothetical protein n=1 Tax=Bursaphelenchus xylophilus TaxID=6326 RepID=A0A1I7SFB4_BURXY|nr:unnamed protein product [Bursaphelenchus xylophilus]CAG9089725.1 unnamed protein product [Bursaphelenchus xylophilus]
MEYVVNENEMKDFVIQAMTKVGTDKDHAAQLADCLICADKRGHYSHGLNRLHIYIEDTLGNVAKSGTPKILKQKGATAWVDGQNLVGPMVGNFCMDLAIKLAKTSGIGWVVSKGTNHYGICGHYALKAAEQGFVGMSFTNTSPCVYPNRAKEQALGSNPICCVAPAKNGDNFALDMASTTVAFGKVELAKTKGFDKIPEGWGADVHGNPTRIPDDVLNGGGLVSLGGSEERGSYKGTGLGMMVEMFCGIMAGSSFGKNVRQWRESNAPADLAQCFVAIDPECFADGFADRLQQFLDETRGLKPADPAKPVLVPGDPERQHEERSANAGGLIYSEKQLDSLKEVSVKYNIPLFNYHAK